MTDYTDYDQIRPLLEGILTVEGLPCRFERMEEERLTEENVRLLAEMYAGSEPKRSASRHYVSHSLDNLPTIAPYSSKITLVDFPTLKIYRGK